ncbi:MAG: MBG domain-containing protein, partial [Bianqueaceae bacterium]
MVHISGATVTIYGGTVTGSSRGVDAMNSTVHVHGGEMKGTGAVGTGMKTQDSTVTVTNGTFIGGICGLNADGGTCKLSGGVYQGGIYGVLNSTSGAVKDLLDTTQDGKHFAYYKGNTVSAANLITTGLDGTGLSGTVAVGECTHSYRYADNQNGTHTGTCVVCSTVGQAEAHTWREWMEDSENGGYYHECTGCGAAEYAVVSVTPTGGETDYYTNITAAWTEAQAAESATVTLLASVDLGGGTLTVASGDNITLTSEKNTDGNGYTLSGSDGRGVIYVDGGSFTLKSGTISGDSCGVNTSGNRDNDITVTGGTITVNASSSTIVCALRVEGGSVTIRGGDFGTSSPNTNSYGVLVNGEAAVTISGGTFSGGHNAIFTDVGTVGELLAKGYAYRNKTNAEWEYDTSTPGLPSGTYTVVNIPVEITQQPKDTDITYGEDATVSIEAEAFDTDKTISYQWYLDTGLSVKPVATGASLKLSGLDAGEYGDYYCEVTCDGYTLESRFVTVSVKKAIIDKLDLVVTAPEAGSAPQDSIAPGEGYTGTVQWEPEVNKYGYNTAYTATLVLTPDSNHQFADAITGVDGWTVTNTNGVLTLEKTFPATRLEKLTAVTNAPTGKKLDVYHGEAAEAAAELPSTVTYTTESGGNVTVGISWTCEDYDPTGEAVNTFTWKVKDGELADYDSTDVAVSGTITVTNAAALDVINTGVDRRITYAGITYDVSEMFAIDENAGESSYTITGGTGAGTLEGSVLTVTRAGTITIKLTTAASGAYAKGEARATLTVNKGSGSGTVTIEDWTYGGSAGEPVPASATNGTDSMEYWYESIDGNYGSENAPTETGCYRVTATFGETDLYKETTAVAEFTIEPKPLTSAMISISMDDAVFNGGVKTPDIAVRDGDKTLVPGMDYTVSGDTSATGAGTYTIAVQGTGNYTGTAEKTWTVTKADMSVSAEDVKATYDGTAYRIAVKAPEGAVITYSTDGENYVTETPVYIGAGVYIVHYQVTKANYNTVTGSAAVIITARPITITAEDQSKTYGDNDPAYTWKIVSGDLVSGDRLTGIAVTRTDSGEDAGSYVITATQETGANPNYEIEFV